MNGSQPPVSVIIPTYNRAALIGDAISSGLAQCSPSFAVELLIVDDGSTDATGAALREFEGRIRVIVLAANQGRNRARNVGLANATGRYVKFLDSDDVLVPGCLPIEVAAAEEAGADMVIAGWQTVERGAAGRTDTIARFDPPIIESVIDSLLAGNAVPTGAALYSRSLVRDLRWDEDLRKLDDWDWFVRAALRARKIVRTRTISYSWRQHPTQGIRSETMLRNAQEHHAILKKLEEALAKRGELTRKRQKRLAQYFYKEMRVLALCDKPGFEWGVRHIYQLDANFVPRDEERQWWMRVACRFFGVRRALSMHSTAKKCIKRTSR